MKLLKPDLCCDGIRQIPYDRLWQQGIRGLVFDLDNTLTPWHCYAENPALIAWFAALRQQGFAVCILSNSAYGKVATIGGWLGIPVLGSGKKPGRKGFLRALALLDLPAAQTAMIGDQLFTDVYGGNKAGMYTILTRLIDENEHWGTRHLSRPLERLVKKRW